MATALDKHQIQVLSALLADCERELLAQVNAGTRHRADVPYADLAGSAPDEGDEASADLFVDVDHAVMGMELAQLRAIERAQQRLRRGTYGICVDCDAPIAYERLLARPAATRCTACQTQHDRRYATLPRSSL